MKQSEPCVLTINAGSSSIRFAVFTGTGTSRRLLHGKLERIGERGPTFVIEDSAGKRKATGVEGASLRREPVTYLMKWLQAQPFFSALVAVGHRVVHGMKHSQPERITPNLIRQLRKITPYAPEHLPREIELIEMLLRDHPSLPQVACFDTAFHRTMPALARLVPIPRRYRTKGVERYGFHGLSFSYLVEELIRLDPAAAKHRVILAHLGNGASLAAIRDGMSIDTSMGFTPASGLVMGTRSGDLDPGLIYFLARADRMTVPQFHHMVNQESGLRGISGSGSDMRDLLSREANDPRAAEGVGLFCYQAKKWIGSFAAALGGLDTLVFAGGVGENAPVIRERICEGLGFLGIRLSAGPNSKNAAMISTRTSKVKVRVIHSDEELMIARSVMRVLNLGPGS